jgi:ubiquinone/menaquinone biosynthesis C-methylase UbiE
MQAADQPHSENTYVIDAESAAEMARLLDQDRLITTHLGGLLPERPDFAHIHNVLDLACGPGGWAQAVALAYLEIEVVGIDISRTMIEYARAMAQVQRSSNVTFRVMDVLRPLDFPDNSFDLVNARLIFGFMPPAAWPTLMQECMRVTRSGGIIRLIECESDITTSAATQQLTGMVTHALQLAGRSFSPDGRHFGIIPMLGHFLHEAGCQSIQKQAYTLDWSTGMEAHESTRLNLQFLLKLLEPFLVKMKLITEEEFDPLYQLALAEMQSNNFCAITLFLSVWGESPNNAR